jgi:hypothetical protein
MSDGGGKGFVELVIAGACATTGWALDNTIAAGLTAPRDSFWARGELASTLLQWGAAVGAIVGYLLTKALLR